MTTKEAQINVAEIDGIGGVSEQKLDERKQNDQLGQLAHRLGQRGEERGKPLPETGLFRPGALISAV